MSYCVATMIVAGIFFALDSCSNGGVENSEGVRQAFAPLPSFKW